MRTSISVVIAAYNVAPFIARTVGSVLSQLEAHHELIVVDDGSVDGTGALLGALREAHGAGNMRVIGQANGGVSAARNAGLAAARGDYIVCVDGDDDLMPGSLAALDAVIDAHHPDVIACDFRFWHPDRPHKDYVAHRGYPPGTVITDSATILTTFFADRHMYVWCNVFRRAIFTQLGEPVFPLRRVFEDVATTPRLLSQCASLVYLPRALIDYRQHMASITKSVSEQWCYDFAAAMSLAKDHLHARAVCADTRLHFDVASSHFFIDVVKASYQLPHAQGRRVRGAIKPAFATGLFNAQDSVLASMDGEALRSNDRRGDRDAASQVRRALGNSALFAFSQLASRRFQQWRRQRLRGK
jgi:glycosyltransferase involved in cell wall biosynthesis